MRAPGVTKLSKNEGKSTLWGSLALAVLLAGRRAICADEPAQEVASIDAVILHAVFWKYYFEHIALLLRIYPIISTSYQQLTHGLTSHLGPLFISVQHLQKYKKVINQDILNFTNITYFRGRRPLSYPFLAPWFPLGQLSYRTRRLISGKCTLVLIFLPLQSVQVRRGFLQAFFGCTSFMPPLVSFS